MAPQDVFARLERRASEQEAENQSLYLALVVSIADGPAPEVAEVERVLRAAEKTSDQLRAAVGLLEQRRQWASMASERDDLLNQLQSLEREREANQQEFAETRAAQTARDEAAIVEIWQLQQRVQRAAEARVKLLKSSPAWKEAEQLRQSVGLQRLQLQQINKELQKARAELRTRQKRQELGAFGSKNAERDNAERVKQCESEVLNLERQKGQLEEELRGVDQEAERFESKALVP
jgi:hypothetical protein